MFDVRLQARGVSSQLSEPIAPSVPPQEAFDKAAAESKANLNKAQELAKQLDNLPQSGASQTSYWSGFLEVLAFSDRTIFCATFWLCSRSTPLRVSCTPVGLKNSQSRGVELIGIYVIVLEIPRRFLDASALMPFL